MSVDAADGSKWISTPEEVYLATQRLKELFEGVEKVMLVNDSYQCLRGEKVRELLEACGSTRYLQPVRINGQFTAQELLEMRRNAGCENSTGGEEVEDYTLRGLEELLKLLPTLDPKTAASKARLLWEALADVEDRRGVRTFSGTYRWFYFYQRSTEFPAYFVRLINQNAWIPDGNGGMQQPAFVFFADTKWKEQPFLQSKILFRPPVIQALAEEAGIEVGVLDLLKQLGLTSEAELKSRLGIQAPPAQAREAPVSTKETAQIEDPVLAVLGGDVPAPTPAILDEDFSIVNDGPGYQPGTPAGVTATHGGAFPRSGGRDTGTAGIYGSGQPASSADGQKKGSATVAGKHEFISYIAVHPDDKEADPDGLSYDDRMHLEENAIEIIRAREPALQRTNKGNPGFDLFEVDGTATPYVGLK